MTDVLIKIAGMSISASAAVILILLVRPFLRRTPKYVRCILWAVVGLRLCVPFTFETRMSPVPKMPTVSETVGRTAAKAAEKTAQSVSLTDILTAVWLCGIVLMLIYAVVSYIRMYRRVSPSIRDGGVYLCDSISVPFILGIIFPKIYIPSSIKSDELKYVTAHEMAHIKRGDHMIKPLSYMILSVYWFNPVIWVWYIFLCRDIELACDEKVIKRMDKKDVAEYSVTLLNYSSERKIVSACPVAFGEVGVKTRIKSILNYKKPAFWVTAVSILLCVVAAFCFFTQRPQSTASGKNVMTNPPKPIISERHETEKNCAHEYEKTTEAPDCINDGWEKNTCRLCGEEKITAIPAKGHSYTESIVSPTCTEAGYTSYTCTVCGDKYNGEETPSAGHSYTENTVYPTCTETGYYCYTCTVCGDTYNGDAIPAQGHSYMENTVSPTCTETGYIYYTCTVCGDSYTGEILPKAEHDYSEMIISGLCCISRGGTYHTCKVCGYTYFEESPEVEHEFVNDGKIVYCDICGYVESYGSDKYTSSSFSGTGKSNNMASDFGDFGKTPINLWGP